eukprot:scaffold44237_cov191-Amphora_coffeaeformis.AAC.2
MKVISALTLLLAVSFAAAFTVTPRVGGVHPTTTTSLGMSSLKKNKKDWDNFQRSLQETFDMDNLMDSLRAVSSNVMEGPIGQRGEVYVVAQFTVLVAILGGGIPFVGDAVFHLVLGPLLLVSGLATCVLAVSELGTSLSPWPVANSQTTLKTKGLLYSHVRHPLYAGLLAACAGLALVSDSADRLVLTALLAYILDLKTDREEDDLCRSFPVAYPAYQKDVPH